jgi:hypothetical protein
MFLMTNGTPIVIADDRVEAARLLSVEVVDVIAVDELAPRDRQPELVEALKARRIFGTAC